MASLSGVVGALLTPFDDAGGIDRGALEREYDFLVSHCDAVSVLSAEVTEYRMITPALRRELLVEAVGALKDRTQVIAGISAPSVAEAVELSELAARSGARYAQLLLPARPSGGAITESELVGYVEQVASRSPIPLVAYHHPGLGSDPSFASVVAVCSVDNVVALKDSSRDISRNLRAVAEIQQAGHAQYLTTIQPLLAVLLSGGAGAMMPPPLTLVGAAIRDSVADGDLARAGRSQALVNRFPSAWGSYGLMAVAKAAMEALGCPVGRPAPPYPPVPADVADTVREVVAGWSAVLERESSVVGAVS